MTTQTNVLAKPACDLSNADGDITRAVIKVAKALDDAGDHDAGSAFWHTAMRLRTYDQVVELARAYVEVRT